MTKKPTRFICTFECMPRLSVHQQLYGNHNYILVDSEGRRYEDGDTYTVFTKDDACGRGEYAEELDIQLARGRSKGQDAKVRRIAEAVLASEYVPGLRVAKIVKRYGIFI